MPETRPEAMSGDFLWYQCTVLEAGAADDLKVYLNLKNITKDNKDFTQKWFYAVDGVKREMLATALGAINSGYYVYAQLEVPSDKSAVGKAWRCYLATPGA